MAQQRITTQACNPEDMSYYVMIRETIHGFDNLITSHIHHSVTIITAALGVGLGFYPIISKIAVASDVDVSLYPMITTFWDKVFLLVATAVAFVLTLSSHKRIGLYTDLLVEHVEVAKKIEEKLVSECDLRITQIIEDKVPHAGKKGRRIFKMGIIAFYSIEALILAYLVSSLVGPCFGWNVPF